MKKYGMTKHPRGQIWWCKTTKQFYEDHAKNGWGPCPRSKNGGEGRWYVSYTDKVEGRTQTLEQVLVCETFHGPRPNPTMVDGKLQPFVVDHKDTNKLNNDPKNLRWVTQGDNGKNDGRPRHSDTGPVRIHVPDESPVGYPTGVRPGTVLRFDNPTAAAKTFNVDSKTIRRAANRNGSLGKHKRTIVSYCPTFWS